MRYQSSWIVERLTSPSTKRLNCTCAWCYPLSEIWHWIFTSFKKHIRSGLKENVSNFRFLSFNYRKDFHKIMLTCRYAQSSDIQTVENNVPDNETTRRKVYCQWRDKWFNKNETFTCDYSRQWSAFCDATFTRQTYASGRDSMGYTWYS